ncbi:MAG: arsenosugar biosynthesis radical SAM (seleno)protein ArsS [Thermodesulfobacteriota bacterium]|nr:arsenosugar biosynthesis radical SAM (seleno)protein ArsS [Thermodesulfobacteriota bacterium]
MLAEQTLQKKVTVSSEDTVGIAPFSLTLSGHGLKLNRAKTHTLQVNVGFLCNQTCRHCHLNAGPARKENIGPEIVNQVVSYARRSRFETIDITGGAPELNPNISKLIQEMSPLASRLMLRSNLSALNDGNRDHLFELLKSYRVIIVASFPSLNELQTDSQRGDGIFKVSIYALKKLNDLGYGHKGSGLGLNLVSNPTGAFLPPAQVETEKRFRQVLKDKWGIVFNHLFNFANVPLGRYRRWLIKSGNFEKYMAKLSSSFNPCSVQGVMCRTMVSVSWDGYLYDCDFNLARDLFMGRRKIHVSEMSGPPEPGSHIATADHCYTCTAGTGFT